jgi:hypothetical protein
LVEEQLEEERATKNSLEQRGSFVITSAGAIVTLLFGLAAVVTSRTSFNVPDSARFVLVAAVGFFFLAAMGGLLANLPWRYAEVDEDDLRRLVQPAHWDRSFEVAARRTTEARIGILSSARETNAIKAAAVSGALLAEVVAVALVATSVGIVLS